MVNIIHYVNSSTYLLFKLFIVPSRKKQNTAQRKSDMKRRSDITHRRRSRRLGFAKETLNPVPFVENEYAVNNEQNKDSEKVVELMDFLQQANFTMKS